MAEFNIDPETSLATTRNGIPYVMRGGLSTPDTDYIEDWTPNLVNASFVAIVAWADSDQFVLDMLGEHQQSGTIITRWNPEPHPYIPFLYCVGCKYLGNYGAMSQDEAYGNAIQFEYVAIACTFAAFFYDVKEDYEIDTEIERYVERRGKNIGQSISTNGMMEYVSDANGNPLAWTPPKGNGPGVVTIPTPPAKHMPYREMTYTWRYVPGPIDNIIANSAAAYGKVNNDYFDPLTCGTTYEEGTVLYLGMEEEPIVCTPAGNLGRDRLYNVPHKFAWRPQGWNTAYRIGIDGTAGDFDGVRASGTGKPPYEMTDFTKLFEV
jgi:hypothetical protein